MEEHKSKQQYHSYINSKIYSNIVFAFKYLYLIGAITALMAEYFLIGKLTKPTVFLLMRYASPYIFSIIVIKFKLIKNFEDYSGSLILIVTNSIIFEFDLIFSKFTGAKEFMFARIATQMNNIFSWFLIQNCKREILTKIAQSVFYVFFRKYYGRVLSNTELVDVVADNIYFMFLSYVIQSLNWKLFTSYVNNLKKSIYDLSIGMDKISENLFILEINDSRKLSVFHCSQNFISKFENHTNVINKIEVEKLLKNFFYVTNKEINSYTNLDAPNSHTLLNDLDSFLYDFNKEKNKTSNQSSYCDDYIKNIYVTKEKNGTLKYFEVKLVIYSPQIFEENIKFVMMLFKNIDHEAYNSKNQQMLTIGKQLVSIFKNEMDGPLQGLKAQIMVIKKEINTKIEEELSILKTIQNNETNYLKNEYLNGSISQYTDLIDFRKIVVNLLNSNSLHNNYLKKFIKFSKYLHFKIENIMNNCKFYSEKSLANSSNIHLSEYNLFYLLNKSLKNFKISALLHNNTISIDLSDLKDCIVKMDLYAFSLLIKNLFLLFEKFCVRSNITIKGNISKNAKNREEISIKFFSDNYIKIKDCEKSDSISTNAVDIFTDNNINISKFLDIQLSETFDIKAKTILFELKICSFISNKLINYQNRFDLLLNEEKLVENEISNYSMLSSLHKFRSSCLLIDCAENSGSNNFFESDSKHLGSAEIFLKLTPKHNVKEIMLEELDIFSKKVKSENSNSKIPQSISSEEISCECFKILIVDDDRMCVNYTYNVLKTVTSKIITASDGKEAFDLVKSMCDVDCKICRIRKVLILMDIHMPIMNGIESAKLINNYVMNRTEKLDVKIYFISGNSESQYFDILKSIPICIGHANKPIKKKEVIKIVSDLL